VLEEVLAAEPLRVAVLLKRPGAKWRSEATSATATPVVHFPLANDR
jgi:hypothetical protein